MPNITMRWDSHRCSRCGRTPSGPNEILEGCSCGNRFFRIISPTTEEEIDTNVSNEPQLPKDDISDIRIVRPGVYELSLESLMKKKKASLVLASNEPGKYTIRF